jgi:hypothetical protein
MEIHVLISPSDAYARTHSKAKLFVAAYGAKFDQLE